MEKELFELSTLLAALTNPGLHWDLSEIDLVELEMERLRVEKRIEFLLKIRKSVYN